MKLRYILLLFVAVLLVVGTGPNLSAQGTKPKAVKAVDPALGTWKLNIEKSKLPPIPTAPKELTLVIRAVGDEYEVTETGTLTNGSPISQKGTNPKQGGIIKVQQGSLPEGITIVQTVIDTYNQWTTTLKDGKQVSVAHAVFSKDGKTMTSTIKEIDAKGKPAESMALFDKQ
jgi:hypothetical protein